MASVRIGGDPSQYMQAPSLTVGGDSGGPSFIASLLDLLGIHKQVANETGESTGGAAPEPTQNSQPQAAPTPAPAISGILDAAESAFTPSLPMAPDWGEKWMESLRPLQKIDPN